jgi:hypothetical protein
MAIPIATRIDERDRTFPANAKTSCLGSKYSTLDIHEASFTKAPFQMLPSRFTLLNRGTFTRSYA